MQDQSIQQVSPNSTALNAESYQSFEMAKTNDGILGGDDIAQIRSYAAFARAQAQAIHKSIATMGELEDVAQAKAEMTETSQTFAKVSIYADQRIGEILRELPKAKNQYDVSDLPVGKVQAVKDAGLTPKTASQLEQMAANPDVVEAVIAKAEQDGRVVSRSQVLKAIKERDEAIAERDKARKERGKARKEANIAEWDAAELRRKLAELPEPEVIEREVVREVVPEDYESIKRENERLNREYQEMWRKKRELDAKLAQANELLGEHERTDNATRDIEHLTIATNTYLRNYGGKAWAFDQFYRVDEPTQQEFIKAITSLAAFAQNMAALVSDKESN